MKKIIIITVALVIGLATSASAGWRNVTKTDVMTGHKDSFAVSELTFPVQKMDRPYHKVSVRIVVQDNGAVSFQFDRAPNLNKTKTYDGHNRVMARIRWDDTMGVVSLNQNWGSNILWFNFSDVGVGNIMKSSTVLLELDWYGEGLVYFKISLKGSSNAIKSMR